MRIAGLDARVEEDVPGEVTLELLYLLEDDRVDVEVFGCPDGEWQLDGGIYLGRGEERIYSCGGVTSLEHLQRPASDAEIVASMCAAALKSSEFRFFTEVPLPPEA